MDRGAWWATVHGVAESDMTERLSLTHSGPDTHIYIYIYTDTHTYVYLSMYTHTHTHTQTPGGATLGLSESTS